MATKQQTTSKDDPKDELFEGTPIGQLPLFDGFRTYRMEIALGGSVSLSLSQEDNRRLHDALRLNRQVVVHVTVPSVEGATFELDGRVQQKTHKLKRNAEVDAVEPTQIVRIQVEDEDE